MKTEPGSHERRRRLRDRLEDREGTDNDRLCSKHALANHLLLFDDELRETAMALGGIESYLSRALKAMESRDLSSGVLESLAADPEVESRLAELDETLASLKRRLRIMATQLR
ncbi:MAG: hypothetical protein RBU30_23780 [Polyangia bacterium]|jgi:hypothetical protein|nr:hypothetical protein [Polyangia bacterium]